MLMTIVITSYIFAVVSFVLFVFLLVTQRAAPPASPHPAEAQGTIADLAALIEALSKLTDSLAKAGPVVMTLVATIFFLLIALMGTGFTSAGAPMP